MTQTNTTMDDTLIQDQVPTQESVDEQNIEAEKAQENPDIDYKEKAAQSFKEAMRLKKEGEKLTAENLFYKNVAEVAKDNQKLHEIAQSNPEMADRIVKHYGLGETYQEILQTDGNSFEGQKIDPKQAAREVYEEINQKKEKESIEDFEVQFFIDNNITIGTPKYKQVMDTYSRFPVKTLRDSKELLTMIYKKHNPNVEVELPSPNGDFGSKGKVKPEFSEFDRKIMAENGWDAEKMRKFKDSPMASWA